MCFETSSERRISEMTYYVALPFIPTNDGHRRMRSHGMLQRQRRRDAAPRHSRTGLSARERGLGKHRLFPRLRHPSLGEPAPGHQAHFDLCRPSSIEVLSDLLKRGIKTLTEHNLIAVFLHERVLADIVFVNRT